MLTILKEQHLLKLQLFCSIIKVLTVTFDQFNASLLSKSTFFYWRQTFEQKFVILSFNKQTYSET